MKRTTVYLEDDIHKAIKIKAAEDASTLSAFINETVRESLADDLDDLQAFRDREDEPAIEFEAFLKKLKAKGKI